MIALRITITKIARESIHSPNIAAIAAAIIKTQTMTLENCLKNSFPTAIRLGSGHSLRPHLSNRILASADDKPRPESVSNSLHVFSSEKLHQNLLSKAIY